MVWIHLTGSPAVWILPVWPNKFNTLPLGSPAVPDIWICSSSLSVSTIHNWRTDTYVVSVLLPRKFLLGEQQQQASLSILLQGPSLPTNCSSFCVLCVPQSCIHLNTTILVEDAEDRVKGCSWPIGQTSHGSGLSKKFSFFAVQFIVLDQRAEFLMLESKSRL